MGSRYLWFDLTRSLATHGRDLFRSATRPSGVILLPLSLVSNPHSSLDATQQRDRGAELVTKLEQFPAVRPTPETRARVRRGCLWPPATRGRSLPDIATTPSCCSLP